MAGYRRFVQPGYQAESKIEYMGENKEEQKDPGSPLEKIEPISSETVRENIRLGLGRNYNAVNRME